MLRFREARERKREGGRRARGREEDETEVRGGVGGAVTSSLVTFMEHTNESSHSHLHLYLRLPYAVRTVSEAGGGDKSGGTFVFWGVAVTEDLYATVTNGGAEIGASYCACVCVCG